MPESIEYMTTLKTKIAETLIDRGDDVVPENVLKEMKRVHTVLGYEIITLEGQIADSK